MGQSRVYGRGVVPALVNQHTKAEVGGTTNEVPLFSTVIPGGFLGKNGKLEIISLFSVSNSANNKTLRIKFGGVTIFSGTVSATVATRIFTDIVNRDNEASQVIFQQLGFSSTTAPFLETTVNTSVNQILEVTGQTTTETPKSVSSLTRIGQTATATSNGHGYTNGDWVLMAGANQAEYNGTFQISNVTTNTFDYTVTGTPVTPATGTITAAKYSRAALEAVSVEAIRVA